MRPRASLAPVGDARPDARAARRLLRAAHRRRGLREPLLVGHAHAAALRRRRQLRRRSRRTASCSASRCARWATARIVVTGTMTLGLGLALLLDRPGRFFGFVRASVFSAYVVSWVAVALLWMWLLDGNTRRHRRGSRARLGAGSLSLLGDPRWALPALAAVGVWKLTGYAMIVFLAGLQGVPRSLLEAAALDGAGPWARFRHVTMPLLMPTAAFVATTSLVTSFQAFDVVRIMTQGGPARATELFVYAIYEQIFLNLSVGRASALTVVFFVLLLAVAGVQLRAWRARDAARRAMRQRPDTFAPVARARLRRGSAAWLLPYAWMVLTSFKTLPGDRRPPDRAAARAPRHRRLPRGLRDDPGRSVHGHHGLHGAGHRALADRAGAARRLRARQAALRRTGLRLRRRARVPARPRPGDVRAGVPALREAAPGRHDDRARRCPSRRARSAPSSCARRC